MACSRCGVHKRKIEAAVGEKDTTIAAQAALIEKIGDALQAIAYGTGKMPEEQEKRDTIAKMLWEYSEWRKANGR